MMSVEGVVIDATYFAGAARYPNHSRDPNTVSVLKTFESEGPFVVLRAMRDIQKGEQVEADYKLLDINWYRSCNCRSRNCRKLDVLVFYEAFATSKLDSFSILCAEKYVHTLSIYMKLTMLLFVSFICDCGRFQGYMHLIYK